MLFFNFVRGGGAMTLPTTARKVAEAGNAAQLAHFQISRVGWSTLGARVPGFQWEHAECIAGIETLCPAFAQQEHPVHI